MTHLDLFSGIGGFALAARWAGFETTQFVEIEPFCQRVLAKNFPGVPIHGDIRTFDATGLPRPTLVTGGFPCQDISAANSKAVGIGGERSGLVTEVLRIVGECRPWFAVLENSPRLRVRGGDWLLGELEAFGYRHFPALVAAGDAGAGHIRERAFVLAHLDGLGGDAPREARLARLVAPDGGRFRPSPERGRLDLVLRPGAVPSFRFEGSRGVVSGPCLLRSLDGVPAGVDRIRALGNAIYPEAVYPILAAVAAFMGAPS